MKVLLAHNYYQQPGGEDQVFADETWLLESHGHEVVRFTVHNDQVRSVGKLRLAAQTIWNANAQRELGELMQRERPAVAHFQNTFPLISAAAYYAGRANGVAVVQELPNYRLLCPSATLFREGRVCEDCLGKLVPWPAVMHGCYRESRGISAVVAAMLGVHRLAGTYEGAVDAYIALTEFGRRKFIEGGLPESKLVVKGNFIHPDPGAGAGSGGYAVFVGRLSPEKGVSTLLAAWERLGSTLPLKILGDGPMAETVRAAAGLNPAIEWRGRRPLAEVLEIVGNATCLVFPSTWYEGQPKTLLESFAKGTPVVASRLGAMEEMIDHGRNGMLFGPGNADDLARQVEELTAQPHTAESMRIAARNEYERKYTAEKNYSMLMAVYERAMAAASTQSSGLPLQSWERARQM